MLAVLQARMSSQRLPGKVLLPLNQKPSIFRQIERMRKSAEITKIVIATSTAQDDDEIVELAKEIGVDVFRGPLNDVYERFRLVLSHYNVQAFIRSTADCPLFMPDICDEVIRCFYSGSFDYVSNTIPPTFPDGCDVEVINTNAFLQLAELGLSAEEREHVTLGIYKRPQLFRCSNYTNPRMIDESTHRWTLDTEADYTFIKKAYKKFLGYEDIFTYDDVMKLTVDISDSTDSIGNFKS